MIHKLEKEFIGKGDVSGFKFKQLANNNFGYLYEVLDGEAYHYEVFKIKITPVCLDFKNRVYSDTEFKEVYPKSKEFGITAWTYRDVIVANEKLESFNNE